MGEQVVVFIVSPVIVVVSQERAVTGALRDAGEGIA